MSTDTSTRPAAAVEQGRTRRYGQPRNPWLIVTRREIMAKLTDKAFITGTLTTLGLIIIGAVVSTILSGRGTQATIAVVDDQAAAVVEATHQTQHAISDKNSFTTLRADSVDQARQKVTSGDAKAVLVRSGNGGWEVIYDRDINQSVQDALSATIQSQAMGQIGQQAGLTQAEVMRQTTLVPTLINGSVDKSMIAAIAGFAFAVLFFMSSLTFGMQIAGSVVEEKSSRIVEIISAAIPIRHLLAGKILGNTLLAFAQMALFSIVGLIGLSFTDHADLMPSLTSAVVWFLVYFIAGFLALACVWAVAGSLASRQEDLQSTTAPLTITLTLVYVAGLFATGTLQKILSYVPVLSSVLMPRRLVAGEAHWWELVIGLVINLAFALGTVVVGEKIYRRSLLQTSGAISYREALKLTD